MAKKQQPHTANSTEFETERLRLAPVGVDDAPFMLELLNDPAFIRFIGDREIRTIDQCREYLRTGPIQAMAETGFGLFVVTTKSNGEPIGICSLLNRDALGDPDIGFAFLPAHTGQGFAIEATRATLDFARNAMGLTHIVAITDPANERSISLLKKIGLRFEKMVRIKTVEGESMLFVPAADGDPVR